MLTWILITFTIALIFGVIKIEQIKDFAANAEPKVREYFNKAKNWSESKAAELKTAAEKQKKADNSNPESDENK